MITKNFVKKVVCTQSQFDALANKQEGVEYNIIGNPTTVSGTKNGNNWATININGTSGNIPSGSAPSNMVTTDTSQNITNHKLFKDTYIGFDNTTLTNHQQIAFSEGEGVLGAVGFYDDDLYLECDGKIKLCSANDTASPKWAEFSTDNLTEDRIITIPDKTGTLAVTDEVHLYTHSIQLTTSVGSAENIVHLFITLVNKNNTQITTSNYATLVPHNETALYYVGSANIAGAVGVIYSNGKLFVFGSAADATGDTPTVQAVAFDRDIGYFTITDTIVTEN